MTTVPLSQLTTMAVGGPADVIEASTEAEIVDAARAIWADEVEWLILGGGSNTVASDEPFDGTVLRTASQGIEVLTPTPNTSSIPLIAHRSTARADRLRPEAPRVRIRVEAGHSWDDLVAETVDRGWSGLEALSGIPGATGASPIQNIGAYGQELAATLVAVHFLDQYESAPKRLRASELGLGYRTSVFKQGRLGVVTAVEFELSAPDGDALSQPLAYAQLAHALGAKLGDRVPIRLLREAVLELRRSKGMVLDAADPDTSSAGSFFTNPIVSERFARTLPDEAPRWPTSLDEPDIVVPLGSQPPAPRVKDDYRVKLSAAWLIEHAGIGRGFSLSGSRAAISSKHSLAITNRGGATAREVVELARYVRAMVQVEFGVLLQAEPVLVGTSL
jgi:UDP-N-acetylmuramate dehydrogenase